MGPQDPPRGERSPVPLPMRGKRRGEEFFSPIPQRTHSRPAEKPVTLSERGKWIVPAAGEMVSLEEIEKEEDKGWSTREEDGWRVSFHMSDEK